MAYRTSYVPPIFFVRWLGPELAELSDVTAEFMRCRERAGHPIVYIAIVPEDCAAPDEQTRKGMVTERDIVLPECITMHIVMEGSGFKHAILRNALAAMQLVIASRDKRVIVGRTLQEALAVAAKVVPEDMRFDIHTMMAKALAHGIATPPPATKLGSRD